MAAPIIQADYEVLEKASNDFKALFDMAESMFENLRSYADELCSVGFEGEAADKFEEEMRDLLFPRLQRLCEGFELSAQVTKTISDLVSEHEQRACGCFKD